MHGFAAQEFADARTQHGAPIAHARVGGSAAAFELHLQPAHGFAQQDGPPVAQLPGPHAKLVAAVNAGQGAAAGQAGIARERMQRFVRRHPVCIKRQQLRHVGAGAYPVRLGQGGGLQCGEKRGPQAGERTLAGPFQRRGGSAGGKRVHRCIVSQPRCPGPCRAMPAQRIWRWVAQPFNGPCDLGEASSAYCVTWRLTQRLRQHDLKNGQAA